MKKHLTIFITILIISNSYSQCKDMFIGNIYQFNNNDLFFANVFDNNSSDYYIDIFFKDEFDKDYLDLEYTDDFEIRQVIKKDKVNEAFNLRGLDTIYFYSKLNDLIGYGTFKKAEYYENMIESRFIAAYEPYITDYSQRPYYASSCNNINGGKTKWVKSENKDLENKIVNTYNIRRDPSLRIFHFTNYNSNTTISMVSYDYSKVLYDFPHLNSFIIKNQNGKLTKLFETGSNYILDNISILPFTFNNHPIILIIGRRPESDFFLNAPIFYDGIKYNFKDNDRSGFENPKGDFNGDGIVESVFIKIPEFPKGSPEDVYGDCLGKCDCYLKFSDKNIPSIKIENCIGGEPENLGDLNNNGIDEIGILPQWWTSCWMNYKVYTFKNGNWKYLVEPIQTHCNSWTENFKIIEKDPNIDGNVIIRYTEMSDNMDFVPKIKSIKVN